MLSDLLTLFTLFLSRPIQVDTPRLQEKVDATKALLHVRTPRIDFTPRYRMKGKSGSAQKFKRKQKAREDQQREYLKAAFDQREAFGLGGKTQTSRSDEKPPEILDRFKPKKKTPK